MRRGICIGCEEGCMEDVRTGMCRWCEEGYMKDVRRCVCKVRGKVGC